MLLLLLPAALAMPPVHVGADVLLAPPWPVAWGELLLSGEGEPRLLFHGPGGTSQHLLLPDGGRWVELPSSEGRVVEGPVDLVVIHDPAKHKVQRQHLVEGAWVDAPGPGLSPSMLGAVAVDADGRLSAFTYDVSQPVLVREKADGTFDQREVPQRNYASGRAISGALWWLDENGVGGPSTLRRDLRGVQGWPQVGLDADRKPALSLWEPGWLELKHAGGTARLAQPRDVETPAATACLSAPCRTVAHYAQPTGAVPFAGGLLVPYVRTTIRQEVQCRVYDGPLHPCDPPSADYVCPETPKWSCDPTQEERAAELRLAWVKGSRAEDLALSARLGWTAVEPVFWDLATDGAGSVHLLVHAPDGDRAGLHYLRLDPVAGRPALPSEIVPLEAVKEAR